MIKREVSKAIITGPTGAIGTALCLELAKNGIEVFAVCRPNSSRCSSIPKHEKIHKVYCDLSSLHELPNLIQTSIDAFYHFGWANTIDKLITSNIPLMLSMLPQNSDVKFLLVQAAKRNTVV